MTLIWVLGAFLFGSLPFSVWVGRLALGRDIRQIGDGNPGATNVLRAGGRGWGALAGFLDAMKGVVPIGLAYWFAGLRGVELIIVALAPVLGHAFSPFLHFKGGKAVAVTFGIWVGLTLYELPTVMGLMLLFWFKTVTISGWAVVLTLISGLAYLALARPDPALLGVMVGNLLILVWRHRADLAQPIELRPWLRKQPDIL